MGFILPAAIILDSRVSPKQRKLELLRHAEKLHQLSGELQEFLDKNGLAVLSLDMLKKAEAAEKLPLGCNPK